MRRRMIVAEFTGSSLSLSSLKVEGDVWFGLVRWHHLKRRRKRSGALAHHLKRRRKRSGVKWCVGTI
ncbi:hypothetical protein C1H46_039936 [Malus baccata]|uniref:Uncharacterized protein n=1 Tax=Malus baccata TaxID=106549 RepID=A0A540KJY8_MALBA|nr:hypothetical protein C1H46_039936 [Malus baccata]